MDYDSITLPIELYHQKHGDNRTRTDDFMLAKHTLYQLSYIPDIKMRIMRFELILPAWKADNLPLIYIRVENIILS